MDCLEGASFLFCHEISCYFVISEVKGIRILEIARQKLLRQHLRVTPFPKGK